MTSPSLGFSERSTTSMSPSKMPAPVMESPPARTKNVAEGRLTQSWCKSRPRSMYPCAGEGNPAETCSSKSGHSVVCSEGVSCGGRGAGDGGFMRGKKF